MGPKDPVPEGYERLERTASNRRAQLHAFSRADQPLHLCVRRSGGSAAPVTSVVLVDDKHGEPVPPGFVRIDRTPAGRCACLRAEKSGSALILCIKRGGERRGSGDAGTGLASGGNARPASSAHSIDETTAPPIIDIGFVQTNKGEGAPPGYVSCAQSPSGRDTTVLAGKGGGALMMVFQQDYTRFATQAGSSAKEAAGVGAAVHGKISVLTRALYSRDPPVVRVALTSLRKMFAEGDKSGGDNGEPGALASLFNNNLPVASSAICALCDAADTHPSRHLEDILFLLDFLVRQPHYLGSGQSEDGGREGATSQSRPPPRNLLRVVGSLVFLYSLFGDDNMEGALPSSTDAVCRATSTSMAALMARVDETNPLGADRIIERRLRREAEAQTSASPGAAGAAHFAVQLILAHVHELRSSMVAAHDAVVATLTLAGHHRRPPKNQGTMPATHLWRLRLTRSAGLSKWTALAGDCFQDTSRSEPSLTR